MVTDTPSSTDKNGVEAKTSAPISYAKIFREQLPYFLSIGMTCHQFWEEDMLLTRYYLKAEDIRNKRRNQELWLQGMYVYEAILDCVPVLHAFAGKGAKPVPYPSEPYPLTEKEIREATERKEREHFENMQKQFETMRASINSQFKRGD